MAENAFAVNHLDISWAKTIVPPIFHGQKP
jgi:hypothetical protein